ncbi:MAG: hypothetical protein ACNYPD_02015 [Candidatus Halichondribacter symbioticus]
MKNKTIKTITCLLAGLTLTACVGTVNLPADEESDNLGNSGNSDNIDTSDYKVVNGGRVGNVTGNYIVRGDARVGNVDGNVILHSGRVGNVTGNLILHGGRAGNVGGNAIVHSGRAGNVGGNAIVHSGRVGNVTGNLILHGGRAGNSNLSLATTNIKNLTLGDLPEIPDNAFIIDGVDNTKPIGVCDKGTKICKGIIPIAIDIEPLNDTNDSSAIYNGSVSVSYFNEAGTIRDITENIDINVDFDDNEISHSSTIDTNLFSIDGDFNSTGQITGNVTYDTVQGNLIGLIGQTEMIGIFGGKAGGFGGGFKATRQ